MKSNIFLSAFLITKNEGHQIKECLKSLEFCDEIIVVDHDSQDDTIDKALEVGCRVIRTSDWPGFGIQKQRALDATKGEWVLSIDADERVTPALRAEILSAISSKKTDGFYIKRRSQFLGRWMRFGGWYPDYVLRLAKRGCCQFDCSIVHEKLLVRGTTRRLESYFLHYSYRDINQVLSKQKNYALANGELIRNRKGGRCSVIGSKFRSCWTFFRLYFLQLGFLDGREGFISASFKSQEVFWKYIAAEYNHLGQSLNR